MKLDGRTYRNRRQGTDDEAIKIYKEIYKTAIENPDIMHEMPLNTVVRRLDEVLAARKPILRYQAE